MQDILETAFKHPSLLGMAVHVCNPSFWEVEAGGSKVQDYPIYPTLTQLLLSKFDAILDRRPWTSGVKCQP